MSKQQGRLLSNDDGKSREGGKLKSTILLLPNSSEKQNQYKDDNFFYGLGDSRIDHQSLEESCDTNEETKNVLHAIQIRKQRNQHSDFYNLLDQVTDRIQMYKSLFLQKRPKFIKDQLTQRVTSQEIFERKLKREEEERKQRMLIQLREKKKKNAFYENLSKKPNKKFKFNIKERKGGIIFDDTMFNSTGRGGEGRNGHNQFMGSGDLELLKEKYMKDKAR